MVKWWFWIQQTEILLVMTLEMAVGQCHDHAVTLSHRSLHLATIRFIWLNKRIHLPKISYFILIILHHQMQFSNVDNLLWS